MPDGDVLAGLVGEIPLADVPHEGLRLYVFGSATRDAAAPRDVDLLLVYADDRLEQAHTLAGEIRRTLAVPPFDVLVASETETAQLDLIAKQQAVQIWPLDRRAHARS